MPVSCPAGRRSRCGTDLLTRYVPRERDADALFSSYTTRKMASPGRETSRPGLSFGAAMQFGKRTYKPNSVVCGHSSRRRVAAGTHQRPTRRFRHLLEPSERVGPMRSAAWLQANASPPIWSCSVWGLPCLSLYKLSGALLPHHFTLTPALELPQRRANPASRAISGIAFPGWPSIRIRRSGEG